MRKMPKNLQNVQKVYKKAKNKNLNMSSLLLKGRASTRYSVLLLCTLNLAKSGLRRIKEGSENSEYPEYQKLSTQILSFEIISEKTTLHFEFAARHLNLFYRITLLLYMEALNRC